jgi:putative zinc finger/helix-turn-helix YgiT family protein
MKEQDERCPACDSTELETNVRREVFNYDGAELSAAVPTVVCKACGFSYVGEEGMEAREIAIRRHLGLLLPQEIVLLRQRCEMSQRRFAEFTRIGVASLSRWESGQQMQGAAMDSYLRLLFVPENVNRLKELQEVGASKRMHASPRFKALDERRLIEETRKSKEFRLCT